MNIRKYALDPSYDIVLNQVYMYSVSIPLSTN